ncbi:MAG: hypothetical protein HXY34_09430 [Candidatus Thorarchaeota archaeon]|nr:hypothetical protein [Candidatus Thorarchaeota archaeon]
MSRVRGPSETVKRSIMAGIYANRMLLTAERDRPEGWKLVSGLWSPFYIQLRLLSSYPEILKLAGTAIAETIREQAPEVNRLVGIAFAGVPIATAASIASGIPACHTRKVLGVRNEADMQKALAEYGQHSLVEGVMEDGDSICLVDDLVTGLESKLVARSQVLAEVKQRGLSDVRCENVAVIIDRQQGAEQKAKEANLRLHSIIRFVDEGLPMLRDVMTPSEYKLIEDYLRSSQ